MEHYETSTIDSLKVEFKCIKDAPKFDDSNPGAITEEYFWAQRGDDFYLVKNPALMTREVYQGASVAIREKARRVVFTGQGEKRRRKSFPKSQNEMFIGE